MLKSLRSDRATCSSPVANHATRSPANRSTSTRRAMPEVLAPPSKSAHQKVDGRGSRTDQTSPVLLLLPPEWLPPRLAAGDKTPSVVPGKVAQTVKWSVPSAALQRDCERVRRLRRAARRAGGREVISCDVARAMEGLGDEWFSESVDP